MTTKNDKHPRPWYRPSRQTWYLILDGRQINLGPDEQQARPSGLPLILAALPQHHHLLRRISNHAFLIAEGLTINPDVLPIDELRERAWQVVEPQYHRHGLPQ